MWSIIGYSLLALLGLLVLLLILPVFVRLQYQEELTVCVRMFGIPVYRFSSERKKPDKLKQPKKKKDKPDGKAKIKKKEKEKTGFLADMAQQFKTEGVSAVLGTVKALAVLAVGALKRVLKSVTVDRLQLQLIIASEDAAATAQNTGKVCAVLYPSLTVLQGVLRIRRRAVTVTPDYLGEKGRVSADVRLHVIPIRILWAALWTVLKFGTVFDHNSKNAKEESNDGK